jgi:hypothetical protein
VRVADVQAFREDTRLVMTNTTAEEFRPGLLWVNAYFSREIDGLAIGETLRLDLREFRNEYGEAFRAGGFFATRRPDAVVLVEIQQGDDLIGLTTILPEDE